MLLEEFDENKIAVINPDMFHVKRKEFPKTCVGIFSKRLIKEFVDTYKPEIIYTISNMTIDFPIYKVNFKGIDIAFVQMPVGAPACVSNYEEIIALGIENFILIGCCGCLEESLEDYSIIIPTSAIRDEGTSYHYLPSSDEVELDKQCVEVIENVIKNNKLHYTKGKTWTTDAIFRETRDKVNKRKLQGAITVEMECSAMTVVSKFRGVNFAQLFYAADNLSQEEYDQRSLINGDISKQSKMLPLGLECAVEMHKKFLR